MKGTLVRSAAPEPVAGPRQRDPWKPWLRVLIACMVAFAALGAFFLYRYPRQHLLYPVGWDSPYYVWRANSVATRGLKGIGAIRAASPLLLAMLMRFTGQNAFTMVTILPAVLVGIVGLAAAVMVQAAFGLSVRWVPFIAVITWLGFGRIGMVGGHLDNILNSAFVLSAFAASVVLIGTRRPATLVRGAAAAILLMGAALAEWPFYVFALGILGVALVLFVWMPVGDEREWPERFREALPIAGGGAVSVIFTGLTFLTVREAGGTGLRIKTAFMRNLLHTRFLQVARERTRYYAFPPAALGLALGARQPAEPSRRSGKRLFIVLMSAWVALTALASLLQLRGVPVAGARLLHFLFAIPILAGLFVWLLARWAGSRYGKVGMGAALVLAAAFILGFGAIARAKLAGERPWFEVAAVAQTHSAGAYVARYAADRDIYYLMSTGARRDQVTLGRWWYVVRASLPGSQLASAHRFIGLPEAFVSHYGVGSAAPIGIVIKRYNEASFETALFDTPAYVVADGVVVINGPTPSAPVVSSPAPRARTKAFDLLWIGIAAVAALYLAGLGWAVVLLPPDPLVRLGLAPGLGAAASCLLALVWDRLGLPLSGWFLIGPLVLSAVAGGAGALLTWRRPVHPLAS